MSRKGLSRRTVLLLPIFARASVGCSKSEATPTSTESLRSSAAPDTSVIRVAISGAFVSEKGVHLYQETMDYVGAKTGLKFEFITGLAYETINSMLEAGVIDIGFLCGLPYVLLRDRDQPPVTLLAAPVMKGARYGGQPKYFSDLIVRKDSSFKKLEDLKGSTYVFNEETSNSGYNLPRFRLAKAGYTKGFFGTVLRSGSHEESIRMVATGKADASYVDSLILEYDQGRDDPHANAVHVIDSIGPSGVPPVTISTKKAAEIGPKLQRTLLEMSDDEAGRKILDALRVARFVKVDDSNYDDIRSKKKFSETAGFATLR